TSTPPSGTSICLRARGKSSGFPRLIHHATATTGTQPTSIDTRNTVVPIEPTKIGTTLAAKLIEHSAKSVNLNGRPIDLKRSDSLAHSRSTSRPRNTNDTRSEELLKKKIVYTFSSVPRKKCTSAVRYW